MRLGVTGAGATGTGVWRPAVSFVACDLFDRVGVQIRIEGKYSL